MSHHNTSLVTNGNGSA
jgi:hypothetical protein